MRTSITKRCPEEQEGFKRGNTERRGWKPLPSLPFIDSSGKEVTKDRRRLPDRRTSDLPKRPNRRRLK